MSSRLSTSGTTVGIPNNIAALNQQQHEIKHTHYFGIVTNGRSRHNSLDQVGLGN